MTETTVAEAMADPARRPTHRHQADQVWAPDFQVDVTADGRQIRFCNLVDEFTREALATAAARSFTADDTTVLLDKVIASFPGCRHPSTRQNDCKNARNNECKNCDHTIG